MTNKSEHPRIDDIGITRQLTAFKAAHQMLANRGDMTQDELGLVTRTGEVFAAVAALASQGDKGLTRLEVMGLLSFAQTAGMVMIGAVHEGNGKASDLRDFYRRTIGPLIKSVEAFERDHADCADCKAQLTESTPVGDRA